MSITYRAVRGTAGGDDMTDFRHGGRWWVVAAMATTLMACSAAPSADPAAIVDEVRADVRATVEAFNARDAERAVRSNAPDFIQMFHGQPNTDNIANLANTRAQLADPAVKLRINDEKVDVSEAGDMVLYSNRYVYDFTDPDSGDVVTETGNWVLVYKRQPDGTLRIYREIISDLPAES